MFIPATQLLPQPNEQMLNTETLMHYITCIPEPQTTCLGSQTLFPSVTRLFGWFFSHTVFSGVYLSLTLSFGVAWLHSAFTLIHFLSAAGTIHAALCTCVTMATGK